MMIKIKNYKIKKKNYYCVQILIIYLGENFLKIKKIYYCVQILIIYLGENFLKN